jgi:electron transfer flavoprotein alpha subunit
MSDVLAVTEHRRGELRDVSLEMITAGREFADKTGGDLHLAVISGDVDAYAKQVNREGVDVIHTVAYGEEFNHDVYAQALEQLYNDLEVKYLITPNSVNGGMDYAPAVADALSLPLVADAVSLAVDGQVEVTREWYGGKVETTIKVEEDHAAVTIRPAEWPAAEGSGDADIQAFDVDIDETKIKSAVTGFEEVTDGDVDISEASFLISIGRGIEEEGNIPLIEALVEATDATLSSSRPLVDNGWLPANRQVGQSGKVVTPDIYIAIGISGAVQHIAGMKGSDTIIAINTDPNAPIWDIADYGIQDDLFEVVPALIEEFDGEVPDI